MGGEGLLSEFYGMGVGALSQVSKTMPDCSSGED